MVQSIDNLTNTPNIYWYVDSVKKENQSYLFKGWIASADENLLIQDLSLKGSKLNINFFDRLDVKEVYPFIVSTKVGFEFYVDSTFDFEQHSLYAISNGIEYNIGLLNKWIIFYSGFENIKHQSIVVVDNFYKDPDLVRNFAIKNLTFKSSNYHKGQRAVDRFILDGTKEKFEEILGRKITNWNYDGYANGIFQFCTADQPIVYHIDSQTYAGIVFLTPDAPLATGTAFYKSKFTGVRKFTNEERDSSMYLDTFTGNNSEPNFYDATQYEKVDEVANVYNRLVLFDARTIHAATQYFGDTITNSRFFHMFFFDVE